MQFLSVLDLADDKGKRQSVKPLSVEDGTEMDAKQVVLEFYPDAYAVTHNLTGGWIIRGRWNGIRWNQLHAEQQATPEDAWKAVIARMEAEAKL